MPHSDVMEGDRREGIGWNKIAGIVDPHNLSCGPFVHTIVDGSNCVTSGAQKSVNLIESLHIQVQCRQKLLSAIFPTA